MKRRKIRLTEGLPWYAIVVAGALLGTHFGLSRFVVLLLLLLGWAMIFFGPYQVRHLLRYWRRGRA